MPPQKLRGRLGRPRSTPRPRKSPVDPVAEVDAVATLDRLDTLQAQAQAAYEGIVSTRTDREREDEAHDAALKLPRLLAVLEPARKDAPALQHVLDTLNAVLAQAERTLLGPVYHSLIQDGINARDQLVKRLEDTAQVERWAATLAEGSLLGISPPAFGAMLRPGGLSWGGVEPPSVAYAKVIPRLVQAMEQKAAQETAGRPAKQVEAIRHAR